MKLLTVNKKDLEIVCVPESSEDLWHLEKVISLGDIVFGHTHRKIKSKSGEGKSEKVSLFVELQVIKVFFEDFSSKLKIDGIIISGKPEHLVEEKSRQSLEVDVSDKLRILKKTWSEYAVERLKKAVSQKPNDAIVISIDEEESMIFSISNSSVELKTTIKSMRTGKMFPSSYNDEDYFGKICEKINSMEPTLVVIVGTGFGSENLFEFIKKKKFAWAKNLFVESTNGSGTHAINELLSGGKLASIQKQSTMSEESVVIDSFLKALAKNKVEYGVEAIIHALNEGRVETLLIAEKFLLENRDACEKVMDLAYSTKSKIVIISAKNPREAQIWGFGGIVVILRR
jgi:protein pelota